MTFPIRRHLAVDVQEIVPLAIEVPPAVNRPEAELGEVRLGRNGRHDVQPAGCGPVRPIALCAAPVCISAASA